jgi:serine/threonine-protein kinase RsbT
MSISELRAPQPVRERLLAVLGRHLSTINAENVLSRAVRDSRLIPGALTSGDVQRLVPAIERGLRLFLPTGTAGTVVEELQRAFKPTEPPQPRRVAIRTEADISEARLAARVMCDLLGARRIVVQKVATVVSELARNAFMYAGGGDIELVPSVGARPRLVVRAVDSGPGIGNLDEVLSGRYRSRTGLGAGLLGTKRLVDRFDIATGPTGTRVEAEVEL